MDRWECLSPQTTHISHKKTHILILKISKPLTESTTRMPRGGGWEDLTIARPRSEQHK